MAAFFDGFMVDITKDSEFILFNGKDVIFSKVYINDWILINGLDGSFVVKATNSPYSTLSCRLCVSLFLMVYFLCDFFLLRKLEHRMIEFCYTRIFKSNADSKF